MKKLLLLITLSFCVPKNTLEQKVKNIHQVKKKEPVKKELSFTADNFKKFLIENDIQFPEIVYAQAVLETGHFTSKAFTELNNAFGMGFPRVRETKAVGRRGNLARFKSWQESILDYKLFQQRYFSSAKTKEDYYQLLIRRDYATGTDYVDKLKEIVAETW